MSTMQEQPSTLHPHSGQDPGVAAPSAPPTAAAPARNPPPAQSSKTAYRVFHPFLWSLIGALSVVALGLSAYLINRHNDGRFPYTRVYSRRLIFVLFLACWTALGVMIHFILGTFLGAFWTAATLIMWTIGASVYEGVVTYGTCSLRRFNTNCGTQTALSAINWTIFALLVILLIAILHRIYSDKRRYGRYENREYYDYDV